MAGMTGYEVRLEPDAKTDLARLRRFDQLAVNDALESYLETEPLKESRSRIKRIRSAEFRTLQAVTTRTP